MKIAGALIGCLAMASQSGWSQTAEAGKVRYVKRANPEFNRYTDYPSTATQNFLRQKLFRLGTYTPYFDNKLGWYPNAWLYLDLYAIHTNLALVSQNPDWILKDPQGRRLYIPWGCSGGSCPQYAADVGNPAFRRYWIDRAKATLSKGYKGLWLDDVNLQFRVSNGSGTEVAPFDPRTGGTMSYDNWRRYMAEFVEQIRGELSSYEMLHNSIWYAGPASTRDRDTYVQRQIAASDFINVERGVTDEGLTGGTGSWSLRELLSFIDRLHARGKAVVFDEYYPPDMEYVLGNYFLISTDRDMIGDLATTPDNWWAGYDVQLGTPSGSRYDWSGLMRRDFSGGMVLVNEPGGATRTVTLPGTYQTISGAHVNSVTLRGKSAAVLRLVSGGVTVPAPPPDEGEGQSLGDMNWMSATNGWGPAEKNMSVGEAGTADGRTMSIGGVTYAKGLGVHAPSDIRYNLGQSCTSFTATVGVDDEVGGNGSVIFQVYADGAKIYESPVMRGSGGGSPVNVTVAGKRELRLVVTDAGDGKNSDHADWANARLTCSSAPPQTVATGYLSDRGATYSTNGWGPAEIDRSNGETAAGDGRQISIAGKRYEKGLGVHAPSELRYSLAGKCSTFLSEVGVDDEVGRYGSIVFEVWADGTKLFDSGLMFGGNAGKSVSVNLAGKNELRLLVRDGGDGIGSDHGDWADAKLACN